MAENENKPVGISEAVRETNILVTVSHQSDNISAGALSIVFGIIGIFVFAIVFVPLGIISGTIAVKKNQAGLGITGIILSIIAAIFSPTFWAIFRVGAGH